MTRAAVHRRAFEAWRVEIPVVPVVEKRVALPRWDQYQTRMPTLTEMREWFGQEPADCTQDALGFLTGYAGLEMYDCDSHAAYDQLRRAAAQVGLLDLVEHLESGYSERTPNGQHLFYRCEAVEGNKVLARVRHEGGWKAVHETRGIGGMGVVAPSRHTSGQFYVLDSGGPDTIPTITPDQRTQFHRLAMSFDEKPPPPPRPTRLPGPRVEGRPGDAYNQSGDMRAVLEAAGWQMLYRTGDREGWRRPGKTRGGISATVFDSPSTLYVFSSNASPFEPDEAYAPFSVLTLLEHGGDFSAAASALRKLGYGEGAARTVRIGIRS